MMARPLPWMLALPLCRAFHAFPPHSPAREVTWALRRRDVVSMSSASFDAKYPRPGIDRAVPSSFSIDDDWVEAEETLVLSASLKRRTILSSVFSASIVALSSASAADDGTVAPPPDVQVVPSGDFKQLFNEGRAKEMQGNIAAAQRIYAKVTKIAPRFIYGWSNLGNTQVAIGALQPAEESYTIAIDLCRENLQKTEEKFGVRRCDDLYVLLLNRGSLRLNNGMKEEALRDLEQADSLRGKPDAVILQNRARARELNGLYAAADRDYSVAISMTSNEVNPFWLRSALVKFQLGDIIGAFDLIRRVENRFPEAPEVRAALAALLAAKGDQVGAQRKFLEIPDRQRKNYVDDNYLKNVISWPPAMIEKLATVTKAVGDSS